MFVGDASMAPDELMAADGSIYVEERSGRPSIACLNFLAKTFPRSAWFTPKPAAPGPHPQPSAIRQIFPMFELNLAGLEKAVAHLKAR